MSGHRPSRPQRQGVAIRCRTRRNDGAEMVPVVHARNSRQNPALRCSEPGGKGSFSHSDPELDGADHSCFVSLELARRYLRAQSLHSRLLSR